MLLPLIEAGGLAAVAGLAIWGLMRTYKAREALMVQMCQAEANFHSERIKSSEEKVAFMQQVHSETLAMVDRMQGFMERQATESASMMRELVAEGTEALALNRAALTAVEKALEQNGSVMERNSETWERLMERVAS